MPISALKQIAINQVFAITIFNNSSMTNKLNNGGAIKLGYSDNGTSLPLIEAKFD